MRPFTFDPLKYAAAFKTTGYVHIKGGVSDELLGYAKERLAEFRLSGRNELSANEIKNKKKQCLFDLPNDHEFLRELNESIAVLADLPIDRMTVSERHIKVYEDNAAPRPPLHKDCVASQVAVGIPLENASGSRLVLLPSGERHVNPFDHAIYGFNPDDPLDAVRQSPDFRVSEGAQPRHSPPSGLVELDVPPGDVVIFAGSSIYHERFNAARSAVLYLKFNAMRLDHLAEDPSTLHRRDESIKILRNRDDDALMESLVETSPRLRSIDRHYTRLGWASVLRAHVDNTEFMMSEDDLTFLFALRGPRSIRDVLLGLGVPADQLLSHATRIRRLCELGGLDLLS
ncbi:MAG: hypothetical protein ACREQX_00485 [Candidatus Binataceae bacterium]